MHCFRNKDKLIANANNYLLNNTKVLLKYIEGRRGRVIHLFANNDYRIVYVCDEYESNGTFAVRGIQRKF